jgi:hypothetical protein
MPDMTGGTQADHEQVESELGQVEIFWHGRCEVVFFPLPKFHRILRNTNKERFRAKLDMSGSLEKRQKSLMEHTRWLVEELAVQYSLFKSPVFSSFSENYTRVKNGNYVVVTLLVIVVMFATRRPGASALAEHSIVDDALLTAATNCLAAVAITIYALMIGFQLLSFAPNKFLELQREMDTTQADTEYEVYSLLEAHEP